MTTISMLERYRTTITATPAVDPATPVTSPAPTPAASPGSHPEPRPGRSRTTGSSASVCQAEEMITAIFQPIRRGTDKIAGYETNSGRHLAIDRKTQRIQIWTEAVDELPMLGTAVPYPASRPRHSNLASQAPRVAAGRNALLWKLDPSELPAFLQWYQTV